jgi:hypothetical protein
MRQNDKILRYLTVRTDEDLKRAARRQPAGGGRSGAAPSSAPEEREALGTETEPGDEEV